MKHIHEKPQSLSQKRLSARGRKKHTHTHTHSHTLVYTGGGIIIHTTLYCNYVLVLGAHSQMAVLQQSTRDVMAPDAKGRSKQVGQVVLERCEGGGALLNQRAHKLQQLHKKCVRTV